MKKSTQVLMLIAGAIFLGFVFMGLTVKIERFTTDLMPWVSLMFGVAFLCTTIAYGDIKSERTPRQKRVVRILLLFATVVFLTVAIVNFAKLYL